MPFSLEISLSLLLFVTGAHLLPLEFKKEDDSNTSEKESSIPECFFKIVGSQGSIYSPHITQENTTCEWNIDVMKGFVAVLEFELFKLPFVHQIHRSCEFYVEVLYADQSDPIKRTFCPADKVDKVYTDSQWAIVRYHTGIINKEYESGQFGFKINYSGVLSRKPQSGSTNLVLLILLLSLGVMLAIALCLFCLRCQLYRKSGSPNQSNALQGPNVPTREQLQETFELRRNALQEMQMQRKKMSFSIFQSQGSSYSSHLNRWPSNQHLPTASGKAEPQSAEIQTVSLMTTPRSVFPQLQRKWSENSVKRIDHLRTKLVARFSSSSSAHNSSDVSVFFPASDRSGAYSQLSQEEDREDLEGEFKVKEDGNNEAIPRTEVRRVPSIVIEFVK